MTKCVRTIQLFYVNINPFTLRRTITPFKMTSINTFVRIAFIELTSRYFCLWKYYIFSLLTNVWPPATVGPPAPGRGISQSSGC